MTRWRWQDKFRLTEREREAYADGSWMSDDGDNMKLQGGLGKRSEVRQMPDLSLRPIWVVDQWGSEDEPPHPIAEFETEQQATIFMMGFKQGVEYVMAELGATGTSATVPEVRE